MVLAVALDQPEAAAPWVAAAKPTYPCLIDREHRVAELYNLVNDQTLPSASDFDIARMREVHAELDEAVVDAYGWRDVSLEHGFHTYRQMERWTISPAARVEILDRLLEEDHRRAVVEASTAPTKGRGKGAKTSGTDGEVLF